MRGGASGWRWIFTGGLRFSSNVCTRFAVGLSIFVGFTDGVGFLGLATYLLLWPADGILRKEDIRMVYDGSIFQFKADEYAAKQRAKQNGGLNLKRASCD